MSMKVYRAYRLKKSRDLWTMVNDIYAWGEITVKAAIMEAYSDFAGCVDMGSDQYKEALAAYGDDTKARRNIAHEHVKNMYRENSTRPERSMYDFNVTVAVRQHKGRIYIVPYADMRMKNVLDFLKKDDRLEDFCYWNNTDHPEEVPYEEWERRGKIWNDMDNKGGWKNHLLIELCSWERFYTIDPFYDEYYRAAAERDKADAAKRAAEKKPRRKPK